MSEKHTLILLSLGYLLKPLTSTYANSYSRHFYRPVLHVESKDVSTGIFPGTTQNTYGCDTCFTGEEAQAQGELVQ